MFKELFTEGKGPTPVEIAKIKVELKPIFTKMVQEIDPAGTKFIKESTGGWKVDIPVEGNNPPVEFSIYRSKNDYAKPFIMVIDIGGESVTKKGKTIGDLDKMFKSAWKKIKRWM